MRLAIVLIVVVTAALLATSAQSEDKRPTAFREIENLTQEVEILETRLARTQGLLDETIKYVRAQARASEAMTDVLERSENAGFVFGINSNSRKILIKGWRSRVAAAQKDLPGAPKKRR